MIAPLLALGILSAGGLDPDTVADLLAELRTMGDEGKAIRVAIRKELQPMFEGGRRFDSGACDTEYGGCGLPHGKCKTPESCRPKCDRKRKEILREGFRRAEPRIRPWIRKALPLLNQATKRLHHRLRIYLEVDRRLRALGDDLEEETAEWKRKRRDALVKGAVGLFHAAIRRFKVLRTKTQTKFLKGKGKATLKDLTAEEAKELKRLEGPAIRWVQAELAIQKAGDAFRAFRELAQGKGDPAQQLAQVLDAVAKLNGVTKSLVGVAAPELSRELSILRNSFEAVAHTAQIVAALKSGQGWDGVRVPLRSLLDDVRSLAGDASFVYAPLAIGITVEEAAESAFAAACAQYTISNYTWATSLNRKHGEEVRGRLRDLGREYERKDKLRKKLEKEVGP